MMMWHNLSAKFKSTSIQLRAGGMEDVDFIILGHPAPTHLLLVKLCLVCVMMKKLRMLKRLLEVRKVLEDKNTPDDISLEKVLEKADVAMGIYIQGLSICSSGNTIVMRRKPAESRINTLVFRD